MRPRAMTGDVSSPGSGTKGRQSNPARRVSSYSPTVARAHSVSPGLVGQPEATIPEVVLQPGTPDIREGRSGSGRLASLRAMLPGGGGSKSQPGTPQGGRRGRNASIDKGSGEESGIQRKKSIADESPSSRKKFSIKLKNAFKGHKGDRKGGLAKSQTENPWGVRSLQGAFNAATTSSKEPPEIKEELLRVLEEFNIAHVGIGEWQFVCTKTSQGRSAPVVFEVEIGLLPKLNNLRGLLLRRCQGDVWAYKQVMDVFIPQLQL